MCADSCDRISVFGEVCGLRDTRDAMCNCVAYGNIDYYAKATVEGRKRPETSERDNYSAGRYIFHVI